MLSPNSSSTKQKPLTTISEPVYDIEFRSTIDDAWYSARILLLDSNTTLLVKLENFPETNDEKFHVSMFKTVEELDEVVSRFRPISGQLQDTQCNTVVSGLRVCASDSFNGDDFRYFDAVVDTVIRKKHLYGNEEECKCKFLVYWQHGPKKDCMTTTSIENICMIQPFEGIDKRMTSFVKIAKKRFEPSVKSSSACVGKAPLPGKGTILSSLGKHPKSSQLRSQVKQKDMQSPSLLHGKGGTISKCLIKDLKDIGDSFSSGEDLSLSSVDESKKNSTLSPRLQVKEENGQFLVSTGEKEGPSCSEAKKSCHCILVNNLEKDLAASSIVKFIQNHTSICPQACIFPSSSSEIYATGVIGIDCEKKLTQISNFLNNPNHFVTSSKGRPWVIREEPLRSKFFQTTRQDVTAVLQERITVDELTVVHREDQAYSAAKLLRDLFVEFAEYQKGVHKSLALEEKEISRTFCMHSLDKFHLLDFSLLSPGLQVGEENGQFHVSTGEKEGQSCSEAPESCHCILVDNLERDLAASSIEKFIQHHTSVCPQACIFPSSSSQIYATAVIGIDCEKKLTQICKFLNNPNHLVTSSKGRPWVIRQEPLTWNFYQITTPGAPATLQEKITVEGLNVVVRSEAQAYLAARLMRDLFVEFAEHQKGLHRRLALEEISILPLVGSTSNLSRSSRTN